jgi:hypothetical protein
VDNGSGALAGVLFVLLVFGAIGYMVVQRGRHEERNRVTQVNGQPIPPAEMAKLGPRPKGWFESHPVAMEALVVLCLIGASAAFYLGVAYRFSANGRFEGATYFMVAPFTPIVTVVGVVVVYFFLIRPRIGSFYPLIGGLIDRLMS